MITLMKTIMATTMLLVATTGTAAAATNNQMKLGGATSQPIGHYNFCKQFPQECEVRSKNVSATKLTKKRWAQIVRANDKANTTVEPMTDQDFYGVEEHWTYPKSYGDCEDYALLKRFMLLQQGWPESSLLITVVIQPNSEGHAVLTVRTDKGDFILDNLEDKVKRWNKTPYKYVKRQSVRHTGRWTDIKDSRTKVANY